jgi:hypothetical protein
MEGEKMKARNKFFSIVWRINGIVFLIAGTLAVIVLVWTLANIFGLSHFID